MDHPGRLRRLQSALGRVGLDFLLVTHLPNVHYLCGFTGSSAMLLVGAGSVVLFTDGRYTEQAREQVKGARVVISRAGALAAVSQWLVRHSRGPARLGFEWESLPVSSLSHLKALLPARLRTRAAMPLIESQRVVKDKEELDFIRESVLMGASLIDTILGTVREGVSENAVAAEIEYRARLAGAEAMSFETIIAAGQRSALPHGRATPHLIPGGGFVVCDFGVILHGYCSDMTRTLWVGNVTAEARSAYQAVREAQQAAIEAVRPGVSAGEVDRAARKVLSRHKLGRFFTHSTGHGVGLEIHEAPRIAAGQAEVLCPGMVITIEPGVYLPGKWGIRIEDMVVVTQSGCEVLTPASKELVII